MFPLTNYEATRVLVDDRIGELRRAARGVTHPTHPAPRRPSTRTGHLARLFG